MSLEKNEASRNNVFTYFNKHAFLKSAGNNESDLCVHGNPRK